MARLGFNDRISTEVPLNTAVRDKTFDMEFIRGLLEGGQDPNKRDVLGYAALHYVVTHPDADPSVVPLFVEYGADVNIEHPTNVETPLILLLRHTDDCNSSMAMQLIQSGANVNAPDGYSDSWPLNLAILNLNKHCNLDVIQEMINRGARIQGSGLLEQNDPTALHLASVMQRLDVVNCLLGLNRRAVRARDSSDRTPLLLMLKTCSILDDVKDLVEIILKLWNHDSDMNHSDVEGVTPLMAYLESDCDPEDALYVVQTLLDLGADVNRVNRNNSNPLDIVLRKRNLNLFVIRELLARGTYTNSKAAVIQLKQAITRYESRRYPCSEECAKLLIKYSLLNCEDILEFIASEGLEKFMPCEQFREYTAACFAELAMSQSVMISHNVPLYRILTEDRLQKENKRLSALQEQRQQGVVNLNRRAYREDGSYRLSESAWFGVGLKWFDCFDEDCLDVVTHNLLSLLAQKEFPLYEDIISSLFSYSEKDLLCEKLNQLTVYTYYNVKESDPRPGKRITLNSYCVGKLCKYLSVSDVLSLTLAYYHIFV